MKNPSESAVDRLIALALEEVPPRPGDRAASNGVPLLGDAGHHHSPHEEHELPSPDDFEDNPIWKSLLQLKAFLPYIARALEAGGAAQAATALTAEVRRGVAALENGEHDLRESVMEQTAELKRMEQSVAKTQEATDRNTSEISELGDDVKSVRTLMKAALGVLTALVIALTVILVVLLERMPHR